MIQKVTLKRRLLSSGTCTVFALLVQLAGHSRGWRLSPKAMTELPNAGAKMFWNDAEVLVEVADITWLRSLKDMSELAPSYRTPTSVPGTTMSTRMRSMMGGLVHCWATSQPRNLPPTHSLTPLQPLRLHEATLPSRQAAQDSIG
jgi:hypothetical protein